MREPIKCRACGHIIQFVRTKNGKSMPVDGFPVYVEPFAKGTLYYKENGEAVRGYLVAKDAAGAVQVYEPHFYTCEKRGDLKQQKKKPEKDYRTEAEKERKKEEQREAIRQRREEDREAYIKARLAQQSMFSNRDEVYE